MKPSPTIPRQFFKELGIIAKQSGEELEEFFKYKLCPYPLPLFDDYGMRKGKSSLSSIANSFVHPVLKCSQKIVHLPNTSKSNLLNFGVCRVFTTLTEHKKLQTKPLINYVKITQNSNQMHHSKNHKVDFRLLRLFSRQEKLPPTVKIMDGLANETKLLYDLLLEALKKQTVELKKEYQESNTALKLELNEAKKEINSMQKRCIELERKKRKNNTIVFGQKLKKEEILNTLNSILECDIKEQDLNNIYTLGKTEDPPIVLEFISFLKKQSLFKDTEKLKKLTQHGISLTNDLCPEDREELKILKKHLKQAKEQNCVAKIRNLKLIIDGTPYTANQLQSLEEEESTENESEDEIFKKTSTENPKNPKTAESSKQYTAKPTAERTNTEKAKRKRRKIQYSPRAVRTRSSNK
ncbi:unnamed protein product [Ceutorhynchus assimilis]|uniref:Uncharacterized protein n=1 Tax=Ceutorhynchus assimilis TaxID=467358 RepID=A0A9N9QI98_9CUCU|nr:unnamed protein product [Ceutorhynchus assimilis]